MYHRQRLGGILHWSVRVQIISHSGIQFVSLSDTTAGIVHSVTIRVPILSGRQTFFKYLLNLLFAELTVSWRNKPRSATPSKNHERDIEQILVSAGYGNTT